MSALDTPTAPTEAAPSTQEPQTEVTWENSPIAQIYNPDGTPKEGAAEAFKAQGREDLAGFTLRNNQDFFTTLKNGREATAMASRKAEIAQNAVTLPGEDATDEDRLAFREKLGAFKSVEDASKAIWPADLPEGFVKDEKLGGLFAEYAAKHPVNTPEAVQELAASFIAHQNELMVSHEEGMVKQGEENALKTREIMTKELGGPQAFAQFSTDAKEFMTSEAARALGFEFEKKESGSIETKNPLHAAMMSDPTFLRILHSTVSKEKPATLPGGRPMPVTQSGLKERKQELLLRNSGGWNSSDDHAEYLSISAQLRQQ